MSIDPNAVGQTRGPRRYSWTDRDTLLYALGVGADSTTLAFVTENSHDLPQRVLPTFGVIACDPNSAVTLVGKINFGLMVHGSQSVRLWKPLPAAGSLDVTATVTDIQDKGEGKNAILTFTGRGVDPETGELVVETTSTLVIRKSGGFGGQAGQSPDAIVFPEREADATISQRPSEDQPLIYRLSGDRNPLHSDPWFATQRAGFPRTILHGLCTYGFAGRALLAALCDNDETRFTAMSARFASPVFPGDVLTTRIWKSGEGRAVFRTTAITEGDGDSRVVLDDGEVEYVPA